MPNTRRRKFSVQRDIAGRDPTNFQSTQTQQSSHQELNIGVKSLSITIKPDKSKKKILSNSSQNISSLDILTECDSGTSVMTVQRTASGRADKDVTASSSNIDLFHLLNNDLPEKSKTQNPPKNRYPRQLNRDTSSRRDKIPRQHRVKVRSPKRRMTPPGTRIKDEITRQTMGTYAIDWEQEMEMQLETEQEIEVPIETVTHVLETAEEERPSNHSLDDMCRICHGGESLSSDLGPLISACSCRGTVGRVHVKCLERWLTESGKSRCELCGTMYATRRVHRYGVPRALVMWMLSQNAKQLMVDSLGIMLMSPLAVMAAWLSGRTLAGLMIQDSHVTPWPLASTFVLACMTLVCYYCWIVSAATRHALGWWIWYRSQYEVRLQFQNED